MRAEKGEARLASKNGPDPVRGTSVEADKGEPRLAGDYGTQVTHSP